MLPTPYLLVALPRPDMLLPCVLALFALLAAVLWPYMVPLALVYFAEYAMQSGAWTAIGEG